MMVVISGLSLKLTKVSRLIQCFFPRLPKRYYHIKNWMITVMQMKEETQNTYQNLQLYAAIRMHFSIITWLILQIIIG